MVDVVTGVVMKVVTPAVFEAVVLVTVYVAIVLCVAVVFNFPGVLTVVVNTSGDVSGAPALVNEVVRLKAPMPAGKNAVSLVVVRVLVVAVVDSESNSLVEVETVDGDALTVLVDNACALAIRMMMNMVMTG